MEDSVHDISERSDFRSWAIVLGIAFGFLCWGFLIFFAVGDKGPPAWDYSVVEDVPGESPYSTHRTRGLPGLGLGPVEDDAVAEQHIMEPRRPGAAAVDEGKP